MSSLTVKNGWMSLELKFQLLPSVFDFAYSIGRIYFSTSVVHCRGHCDSKPEIKVDLTRTSMENHLMLQLWHCLWALGAPA